MPRLANKRLLFVTGKGGVGKSTVAIALGLAAARRGLRTIVAELGGQERAGAAFGHRPGASSGRELRLDGLLHAISIEPQQAMEEYLHQKAGAFGGVLSASRTFHGFVSATPGMRELLALGKAWELSQERRRVPDGLPYDLVIVDAPATGHGVGALRTPRTFAEIARVGPIASQGRTLDEAFADPAQTAVLAVALAEEMPVNETLSLRSALREELGIELAGAIVNAVVADRLGPRQATTVIDALATLDGNVSPLVHAALLAARSEHIRAHAQREQIDRLSAGLSTIPTELPYLFAPAIDRDGLEQLSEALEGML